MHLIRVTAQDHENYQNAMNLYKQSFPEHEQREEKSQIAVLQCEEYHFDLIFDGDILVGTLLSWETEDFMSGAAMRKTHFPISIRPIIKDMMDMP